MFICFEVLCTYIKHEEMLILVTQHLIVYLNRYGILNFTLLMRPNFEFAFARLSLVLEEVAGICFDSELYEMLVLDCNLVGFLCDEKLSYFTFLPGIGVALSLKTRLLLALPLVSSSRNCFPFSDGLAASFLVLLFTFVLSLAEGTGPLIFLGKK